MDTKTVTLTEFLLARMEEWEAIVEDSDTGGLHIITQARYEHMRAECEAKRRIVEAADPEHGMGRLVLGVLAGVYSDHPDYREEWKR